jgi:hypothetical protein
MYYLKTNKNRMRKTYKFLLFLLLCTINLSFSQITYTSVASGDWNNPTTWSPNGVPSTDDAVNIGNHAITVTVNAFCNSLTTNPGSDIFTSIVTVNTFVKLTVLEFIYVESTNANDNTTYLYGNGIIETNAIYVGDAALTTTTNKETTLYVEDIEQLIVNNNITIESRENTNNATYNPARLRHISGTIDLYGQLISNVQSSGITSLGYLTNNSGQGDSKIVFNNVVPIISSAGVNAPDFSGGTVEFRSAAITLYDLPYLRYKNLILNSPRTFRTTNNATTIAEDGSLQLIQGIMSGLVAGPAVRYLTYENNVTIYIADGSFLDGNGSRPKMSNVSNTYNVTYLQTNASGVKQSGRELTPVSAGPNPLKNLTISNTYGVSINLDLKPNNLTITASCSILGTGKIDVLDVFDVPTSSIVNLTDKQISLISSASNTARVAKLLNNPTINGKVNVQRFLPNNKRSWRLLTAPVKGSSNNSIYYNWQNNGIYGDIFYTGIEIWGPTGDLSFDNDGYTVAGNGLISVVNSSYNLRTYDNTIGSWTNVTNTVNEPLFNATANKGFLIFAPHSFLNGTDYAGGYIPNQSNLTAEASGALITGDVTYSNILTNKYYLIGNPYASPINFETILAEPGNEGVNKIWVIDPTVGSLGAYVTWDTITGYSNGGSSFSGNTILQSGQAFFVIASSTITSLTIKESHKSDVITNTTLNKTSTAQNNTSTDLFRILLEKEVSGAYGNMDGCVAAFYTGGSNAVDGNDAIKLGNPGENLALFNANFSLSIEHRAPIEDNDFLTLRLTQAIVGSNYKLKLYTENFTYSGNAFLQDIFTGTTTQLPTDGSVFEYPFQVTSNSLSLGNRFRIVFQSSILNVNNLNGNYFSVYPNPAKIQDTITVLFHSDDSSAIYDYKIYTTLGQLIQSDVLNKQSTTATILLTNKLTTGLYFIQLHNLSNNQNFTQSLIIK